MKTCIKVCLFKANSIFLVIRENTKTIFVGRTGGASLPDPPVQNPTGRIWEGRGAWAPLVPSGQVQGTGRFCPSDER